MLLNLSESKWTVYNNTNFTHLWENYFYGSILFDIIAQVKTFFNIVQVSHVLAIDKTHFWK